GGLAKSLTRPDDSLIILGDDWNSATAYEAERKAITLPFWTAPATVAQILNRPEDYLGGTSLGAIVYCGDGLDRYRASAPQIQQFIAGRRTLGEVAGCQLLAGQR